MKISETKILSLKIFCNKIFLNMVEERLRTVRKMQKSIRTKEDELKQTQHKREVVGKGSEKGEACYTGSL